MKFTRLIEHQRGHGGHRLSHRINPKQVIGLKHLWIIQTPRAPGDRLNHPPITTDHHRHSRHFFIFDIGIHKGSHAVKPTDIDPFMRRRPHLASHCQIG